MSGAPTSWSTRLLFAAKLAIFALLCWAIWRALAASNEQLSQHVWHVEPGWLVLSAVLYLAGVLPAAVFWHRLLLRTGQEVSFAVACRAYFVSQLGKYVPGKWMVIVLRRGLLGQRRLETTVVAATVFFETFSLLAVGAAVAALVLLVWHPSQMLLIATAVGSLLLLGLPTLPVVFEFLMRVLGVGRLNAAAGAKFRHIGWDLLLVGWLTMGLGWALQGASLWATLRGLGATGDGPVADLPLHTSAVSLSVVAGFLSQIPGGLAVREWVSAQLIEPTYGVSVAVVSAVIYRLVLVAAELGAAATLYATAWLPRPRLPWLVERAESPTAVVARSQPQQS